MSDQHVLATTKIVGPVASAPDVSEQPLVWLSDWRVICDGEQNLYLFGLRPESTKLRMTTAIQAVDYRTRTWVTASGRRYVTEMAPGANLTPELLALAVGMHGLPGVCVDVTDGVWTEMLRFGH